MKGKIFWIKKNQYHFKQEIYLFLRELFKGIHYQYLEDRKLILRYGLIVIDCSWKNIMSLQNLDFKNARKLPPLIAANPTNYGKWEKLSSAEALAAALFITNFKDLGNLILSKFSWGNEFKEINNFQKKDKKK